MSRFIRSDDSDPNADPSLSGFQPAARPKENTGGSSRIYGSRVSMGETVQLEGDPGFRRDLENSLTAMAQSRLMEAETQAAQIIQAAKAEAAKLIKQASDASEAEADAVLAKVRAEETEIRESAHEMGFKEGFEEGYADGRNQAEEEATGLLAGAQRLAEGAYQAEQRVLRDFEKHALKLILHVTEKVFGDHLDESPETLLHLIDRGVESLYLSGKIKIVVSSQLLHEIRSYSTKSADAVAMMTRYEFVADPLLEGHQLYVIGQDGRFDLTPVNQARQLFAPLESHLVLPRDVEGTIPASEELFLADSHNTLPLLDPSEAPEAELQEALEDALPLQEEPLLLTPLSPGTSLSQEMELSNALFPLTAIEDENEDLA